MLKVPDCGSRFASADRVFRVQRCLRRNSGCYVLKPLPRVLKSKRFRNKIGNTADYISAPRHSALKCIRGAPTHSSKDAGVCLLDAGNQYPRFPPCTTRPLFLQRQPLRGDTPALVLFTTVNNQPSIL